MASPKLRKPPFAMFSAALVRLPATEQIQVIQWVYQGLPEVRGLDIWIHLQNRLRDLDAQPGQQTDAPRMEAGEGALSG